MPDQPSKHGRQHHADGPDPTVHSVAWPFKIFSDAQLVATGDGKLIFEIPFDLDEWSLVYVRIYVTTTGSGTTTVQIRNITQGHDLLSTKATIDSGETSSRT